MVFKNRTNPKTKLIIKDKQIIISVNSKTSSKYKKRKIDSKPIPKEEKNKFIDTKNKIRSITTKENKIIIKFNKDYKKSDIKFKSYKYKNKYERVFDIDGYFKYTTPTKLQIDNIDKILVQNINDKTTRIKIIDKEDNKAIYHRKRKELIITLNIKKQTKTPSKNAIKKESYRNDKIVVIDPGHGGHDAGAVGSNKKYEKIATLKVSKYLYNYLKQRGYKVYLTRYKDKFIKLSHRTKYANRKNATIFVSIHANSVPKSKAKNIMGIETFFLSPARSSRAKRVAALENKTDIRNMSNSTKSAFLESLNRPRITASHKLAIDVQAGLLQSVRSKYNKIHDSGVREGPFWVLVGAQMPSILVEIGYISHPLEGQRLYSSSYQKLLANGVANGIDSYFSKNP